MGRELRKVPLDFDWPLNKVWKGFVNPHRRPCPEEAKNSCHNGYSNAGMWLESIARLIACIGQEAAQNTPEFREHFKQTGRVYPHPYLEEWELAPRTQVPSSVYSQLHEIEDRQQRFRALSQYLVENPPQLLSLDPELIPFVIGLSGGEKLGLWLGSSHSYGITRTLLKAAGIETEDWGICKTCHGHGLDPECMEAYENWEPEPPPTGEGWQLWETVSEGSPISPVFASEAAFVDYLVSQGYSEKSAKAFVKTGWVMSAVGVADLNGEFKIYKDIEAAGINADKDHDASTT